MAKKETVIRLSKKDRVKMKRVAKIKVVNATIKRLVTENAVKVQETCIVAKNAEQIKANFKVREEVDMVEIKLEARESCRNKNMWLIKYKIRHLKMC